MSGTTLCVVDMQPIFLAYAECENAVLREIRLARRRNDGIVFLEMNVVKGSHKGTIPKLLNEAKRGGYNKVAVSVKRYADGSLQFLNAARRRGFNISKIRVCGVNRHACVKNTIEGLLDTLTDPKIEIVWSATAPSASLSQKEAQEFNLYKKLIDAGLVIKR